MTITILLLFLSVLCETLNNCTNFSFYCYISCFTVILHQTSSFFSSAMHPYLCHESACTYYGHIQCTILHIFNYFNKQLNYFLLIDNTQTSADLLFRGDSKLVVGNQLCDLIDGKIEKFLRKHDITVTTITAIVIISNGNNSDIFTKQNSLKDSITCLYAQNHNYR